jgi:hypothetical protein
VKTLEPPAVAPEDSLNLRMRLVELYFTKAYGEQPDGTWHAPCPIVVFGSDAGGPALVVTSHWRVIVAAKARQDAALRMFLLEHPDEPVDLAARPGDEDLSPEAQAVAGVGAELARRGLACGADLLTFTDVPDGIGFAVLPAHRAAAAWTLVRLSGAAITAADLVGVLDGAAGTSAAHTSCLLGHKGHAMLVDPTHPDLEPRQVLVAPPAARLRLVVISLRTGRDEPRPGGAPRRGSTADGERAREAFDVLCHEAPASYAGSLGPLLTAAHAEDLAGREPLAADAAVSAALASGALGGRALSPTSALAVVTTDNLRALRSGIIAAFADRGEPAPRFLTTSASES